jgi:SPW repeat
MVRKRWQDLVNGVLGLYLFESPSILGFAAPGSTATGVAWILGLAIVVFAGIAVYMPKAWEEALNIILGVCLLASPWRLDYSDQAGPTTNAVVVGLLVTALAVWAMLMDTAIQKWWHERHLTR